jgi:FkbM family methyltransferase
MNIPHQLLRVAWHEGPRRAAGFLLSLRRDADPAAPDEAALVFDILKDAPVRRVMIDVGAHWGYALRPFLRAGWFVYAFEPDEANRRQLHQRLHRYSELVIDPRALSDRPQPKATLFKSTQSTGISCLSSFDPSHAPSAEVEVTTLTNALAERPEFAAGIGFLKIDTEGFDLPVLRGMSWEAPRPTVIVCEFEDAKTRPLGYGFPDLAGFLTDQGYRIIVSEWSPIERYGQQHRWRRFCEYPCELIDPAAWGNLIATNDPTVFEN